ncbi:hypothetical protein [Rhodopseudomonas parapalustris]
MLDKIQPEIEKLVMEECNDRTRVKGLFIDGHQAEGVIREEIEEARVEMNLVEEHFERFWTDIKNDNNMLAIIKADSIYKRAVFLSCEAVQVAAMAKKYIDSFKEA